MSVAITPQRGPTLAGLQVVSPDQKQLDLLANRKKMFARFVGAIARDKDYGLEPVGGLGRLWPVRLWPRRLLGRVTETL